MHGVYGCQDGTARDCPTTGSVALTLRGANFGPGNKQLTVLVNGEGQSKPCEPVVRHPEGALRDELLAILNYVMAMGWRFASGIAQRAANLPAVPVGC